MSELTHQISIACRFEKNNNLGHYLGALLIHSRVAKATYHHKVEKVQNKLTSWQMKHLSSVEKVTLLSFSSISITIVYRVVHSPS